MKTIISERRFCEVYKSSGKIVCFQDDINIKFSRESNQQPPHKTLNIPLRCGGRHKLSLYQVGGLSITTILQFAVDFMEPCVKSSDC